MGNLDIILLTAVVAVAFIVFIVTTLKEFTKMETETYTDVKSKPSYGRDALYDLLQKLFDDESIPKTDKKTVLKTIGRTMADMESDGLYFPEEIKEKLAKDGIPLPSKKSDTETLEEGK
jgi:hypothetical protein